MFVNRDFVRKHNIETTPLLQPIPVHNVDGTPNENGLVTEEVDVLLQIGPHQERARLAVTNLRQQTVIIGHSWLLNHNPKVDWTNQKITFTRCPPKCSKPKPPKEPDDIPEEWAAEYIQVMTTPSQQFAQQAQSDTSERSFTDLIPEAYHNFEDVFSKDAFNELPPCKVWDHAIDLIPDVKLPHSHIPNRTTRTGRVPSGKPG